VVVLTVAGEPMVIPNDMVNEVDLVIVTLLASVPLTTIVCAPYAGRGISLPLLAHESVVVAPPSIE